MKWLAGGAFIAAALASGGHLVERPSVKPYFNRTDDGPAFFIECRNNTGETLSSAERTWYRPMRVDGTIVQEPPGLMGPGLTTDVEANRTWRGIVALVQTPSLYGAPVRFGALVRAPLPSHLAAGWHTFSIECNGVRSAEVEFYWDDHTAPRTGAAQQGDEADER